MKKTVVIVLLILSIITGCSKNVDYDTEKQAQHIYVQPMVTLHQK